MPRPAPLRRVLVTLTALALAGTGLLPAAVAHAAESDGCYSWSRTLKQGMSGSDVRELQVRVAGWAAYGTRLTVDGDFGPATKTAVTGFQRAYGLGVDGIAGPGTFGKIYALQDDDCTPIHFDYSEMDDGCGGSGFDGGAVSEAVAKRNALETMWKLEAQRRAMGDVPLIITSAFRSKRCNEQVGGAPNSRHLYGDAADLVGRPTLCNLAREARSHGFGGIFGPGYPAHDDHTHVDGRSGRSWSAPDCGVSRELPADHVPDDQG